MLFLRIKYPCSTFLLDDILSSPNISECGQGPSKMTPSQPVSEEKSLFKNAKAEIQDAFKQSLTNSEEGSKLLGQPYDAKYPHEITHKEQMKHNMTYLRNKALDNSYGSEVSDQMANNKSYQKEALISPNKVSESRKNIQETIKITKQEIKYKLVDEQAYHAGRHGKGK